MTQQCPIDPAVFELSGRDLAGKGAGGFVEDILGCYFEFGVKMFAREEEVEGWRSNDNFGVGI